MTHQGGGPHEASQCLHAENCRDSEATFKTANLGSLESGREACSEDDGETEAGV